MTSDSKVPQALNLVVGLATQQSETKASLVLPRGAAPLVRSSSFSEELLYVVLVWRVRIVGRYTAQFALGGTSYAASIATGQKDPFAAMAGATQRA